MGENVPDEVILPVIGECISRPWVRVIPFGAMEPEWRQVDLIPMDRNAAYMRIPSIQNIPLQHGGPLWGWLFVCVTLPRVTDPSYNAVENVDAIDNALIEGNMFALDGNTENVIRDVVFREPDENNCRRVAIKRLYRDVVARDMANGSREDPFKEIFRMQTLVDDDWETNEHNVHVLPCVEAVQDKRYLYIITPYCEQKSLGDWIGDFRDSRQNLPIEDRVASPLEQQARYVFSQILSRLEYLNNTQAICHRDMSPGNCMVYGSTSRVILNDLAMSFRIPIGGIVNPMGVFGHIPYLPPEVHSNAHPYNCAGCDIWGAVIILFNLVVGEMLYQFPEPNDLLFRYFIMAGGLGPEIIFDPENENNEWAHQAWEDIETAHRQEQQLLQAQGRHIAPHEFEATVYATALRIRQGCNLLSPQLLELFKNCLHLVPDQRWRTLEQIRNSRWMLQQA